MGSIPPAVRRYFREAGIAAVFTTIPALAFVVGIVKHWQGTFAEAFFHEGLLWYTWALLTPGILWGTRRFPIDRSPRLGSIGSHVALGLACGLLQGLLILTARAVLGPPSYEGPQVFSPERVL